VHEIRMVAVMAAVFLVSFQAVPLYAQKATDEEAGAGLIGNWEIYETKAPGKPYKKGYKGRPFVSRGPNAFTLVLQYRKDGTFCRISRCGKNEVVQRGKWVLSGHELRHRPTDIHGEEVMYIRFEGPNQYTSIEVFEETKDPGLFAKFRRIR
jgi:hypothetical protein